ncbi:uncharacterized protein LOC141526702 [Cotesia typhae]|uniref:uncharacterized protein LOC141526702 n=1 Tax=Cotesia typhae TaxID=2053667 RepID=UPI003D690F20
MTTVRKPDKNEKCGIQLCNNEFELVPGVTEYQIHYADCLKESNHSGARKRRIEDLIDEVEGNAGKNLRLQDSPPISVASRRVKKKSVEVIWREKTCSGNYQQQRGAYGGIRTMELDRNKDYSFQEIRKLAIAAMRSSKNKNTLNNSIIQLATNDEQIIDEFTDARGQKCSFWDFSYKIKKTNTQLRLCLLSTPRKVLQEITSNNQCNVGGSLDKSKSQSQKTVFTVTSKQFRLHPQTSNKSSVHIDSAVASKNRSVASNVFTDVQYLDGSSYNQRSASSNGKSESTKNLSKSYDNIQLLELSVPVIDEEEIKFSDKILGRGAFGCVILCKWNRNGSSVAVKKIPVPEDKKYLIRELKVLDTVRHPNIISLMAACCADKYWYIVMEYFRSQSLRQFINNRPENVEFSQKRKENYEICLQIRQAVSYLHELTCSIIHKDIKPENILVNEHLMVKLCDLVLSKISDIDSSSPLNTTVGHNFRGTPMFMAPEIIVQNLPAIKPTDVWAMACCLVELFCERQVWVIEPKFTTHALRELLLKGSKPDLTNIPSIL